MRRRTCRLQGCDNEVVGRRGYCSEECKEQAGRESDRRYNLMHREERAQAARERRAAEGDRHTDSDDDQVDTRYAVLGGAAKPPVIGPAYVPRQHVQPELVDYSQGGHKAPGSEDRLRYDGLRHDERVDRVRAERAAREDRFGDGGAMTYESEIETWQALSERNAHATDTRVVSFDVPAPGSAARGPQPQPRVNSIGQSIPRARRWG